MKNIKVLLIFLLASNLSVASNNNFIFLDSCIAFGGTNPQILEEGRCKDSGSTIVTFNPIEADSLTMPSSEYSYGIIVVIDEEFIFEISSDNQIDIQNWIAPQNYQLYGISYHQDSYPNIYSFLNSPIQDLIDSIGLDDLHCYSLSENYKSIDVEFEEFITLYGNQCYPNQPVYFELLDLTLMGAGTFIFPWDIGNACEAQVTVNITEDISPIIVSSTIEECIGGSTVLTVNDGNNYVWTGPNNFSSNQQIIYLNQLQSIDFGIYNCIYENQFGCTRTQRFQLENNLTPVSTDLITACGSYTWIDGNTYTSSNDTAFVSFSNPMGCDSIVYLDLTINNFLDTISETFCGDYFFNGETYTTSGTYQQTVINDLGCDSSVYTLNLIIKNTTTELFTVSVCDEYFFEGTNYTLSGIYDHVYTNVEGCDSIIRLDLIVDDSDSFWLTKTGCNEYTHNDITYTSTGIYQQSYINAAGCDSLVNLNITIDSVNVTITQEETTLISNNENASYQWIDCLTNLPIEGANEQAFSPSAPGNYAVVLTQDNCIVISDCFEVMTVGFEDILHPNLFSIYPNPVLDHLQIQLNEHFDNIQIQIFNTKGKLMRQEYFSFIKKIDFDLQELPSGVYILQAIADGETASFKILKQD